MAATPTQLTDGESTSNPASTAVVSPGVDRLLLLPVVLARTGSPAPAAGDLSVTGLGLTWDLVASVEYRVRRRLYVVRAMGNPSSGSISIEDTGTGFAESQWSLAEWSGVVTGANGANAVAGVATAVEETTTNSLQVTIGGTPGTGDATWVAFGVEEAGGPPSMEAGWTVLSSRESPDVRHLFSSWDADQDQTPTITWTSSGNGAGGVGLVVVASAAATPSLAFPTSRPNRIWRTYR